LERSREVREGVLIAKERREEVEKEGE